MNLYLISYDVSTLEKPGQKRLRQVAKICERWGQRVQKSIFECRLTQSQLEELREQLKNSIEPTRDTIRIYQITEPLDAHIHIMGLDHSFDFTEPLIF